MTTEAWIFMICVWGLIISQTAYCFWKLLTSEQKLEDSDADTSAQ
jgi:hypothetical protein